MGEVIRFGKEGVDPLTKGPESSRVLQQRMGKASSGFSYDAVVSAAANILINVIRQKHSKKKGALDELDQVQAAVRKAVDEHYQLNGSRKSLFPFDQIISVPHLDFKKSKDGIS